MAAALRLCVGMVAALTLWKHSLAEENSTQPAGTLCHRHDNRDNCTATAESGWSGHFSRCPAHLRHYCIHGECRYIEAQKVPSCRCEPGYGGSRCQFLNLDERKAAKRNIIIVGVTAGLVLLVLFLAFICVCSRRRWRMCWRRRSRREEPRNGTEKVLMMDAAALKRPDAREPPHTSPV